MANGTVEPQVIDDLLQRIAVAESLIQDGDLGTAQEALNEATTIADQKLPQDSEARKRILGELLPAAQQALVRGENDRGFFSRLFEGIRFEVRAAGMAGTKTVMDITAPVRGVASALGSGIAAGAAAGAPAWGPLKIIVSAVILGGIVFGGLYVFRWARG